MKHSRALRLLKAYIANTLIFAIPIVSLLFIASHSSEEGPQVSFAHLVLPILFTGWIFGWMINTIIRMLRNNARSLASAYISYTLTGAFCFVALIFLASALGYTGKLRLPNAEEVIGFVVSIALFGWIIGWMFSRFGFALKKSVVELKHLPADFNDASKSMNVLIKGSGDTERKSNEDNSVSASMADLQAHSRMNFSEIAQKTITAVKWATRKEDETYGGQVLVERLEAALLDAGIDIESRFGCRIWYGAPDSVVINLISAFVENDAMQDDGDPAITRIKSDLLVALEDNSHLKDLNPEFWKKAMSVL